MSEKLRNIIIDALILVAVSSIVAIIAQIGVSALKKKSVKDDPIVTAIFQGRPGWPATLREPLATTIAEPSSCRAWRRGMARQVAERFDGFSSGTGRPGSLGMGEFILRHNLSRVPAGSSVFPLFDRVDRNPSKARSMVAS